MKFYISDVLWKSGQAFIFSFVTAPAVALLLILFCTVLTSSPSKVFLDQARSLVGNATSTSSWFALKRKQCLPRSAPQNASDTW